MTTRRHHYVWRYYLRAWATDEKIWCHRDNKKFRPNLMGVAQERDFYKIKPLSENEIFFIKRISNKQHPGLLNSSNEEWINTLQMICTLKKEYDSDGVGNNHIEKALFELEENFYGKIENDSVPFLKAINDGDLSFIDDLELKSRFSLFLAHQYVRTKRIKENFCNIYRDIAQEIAINPENVWSNMRNIEAANIGLALSYREDFKFILLNNETELPFITGDQPILNTHAVDGFGVEIPTNTELYYPTSPNSALLISNSYKYQSVKSLSVNKDEVIKYNTYISRVSYEQVYANQKCFLPA